MEYGCGSNSSPVVVTDRCEVNEDDQDCEVNEDDQDCEDEAGDEDSDDESDGDGDVLSFLNY